MMVATPHRRNTTVPQLLPEGLPEATGLYDPRREHDACGIGLIANISNEKTHRIIADGLRILRNLEHRGAVGADAKAGDGCGMLIQIPHALLRRRGGGARLHPAGARRVRGGLLVHAARTGDPQRD
jgi:glutamate synthase domain-containing protein 1